MCSDIGLIKLPRPVILNNDIKPVNLACKVNNDQDVIAIGNGKMRSKAKGKSKTESVQSPLHYTQLKTISQLKCFRQLPIIAFRSSIVCANGEQKQSICIGHSGSPLVDRETKDLVGISSFGLSLFGCQRDVSQGFTRVSPYLPWIEKVTGITCRKN